MRSAYRGFLAAGLAVVLAGGITAGAVNAQAVGDLNGPLLEESYDVGVVIQHLKYLDGTEDQLPSPVGNRSAFSPDGTKIATTTSSGVSVRHTDWRQQSYGTLPSADQVAEERQWLPDGSGVVASVITGDENLSLWLFEPGAAPKKVYAGHNLNLGDSFAVAPSGGRVLYIKETPDTGIGDRQEIYATDLATGVRTKLTDNCPLNQYGFYQCEQYFADIVTSPGSARPMVEVWADDGAAELWWLESNGSLSLAFEAEADPIGFIDPVLSPDGTKVAWIHEEKHPDSNGGLELVSSALVSSVSGGATTSLPRPVHAWQPCPGGVCPVFDRPVPPQEPKPTVPTSVTAASGATGTPVTAKVSWAPPTEVGNGLTGYVINAVKMTNGSVVANKSFSATASTVTKTLRLAAGRWKFRVRAKNNAGLGPWSAFTGLVTAR